MKKRIVIPYLENQNKSIVLALSKLTAYSDMSLEQSKILAKSFYAQKDVYYDILVDQIPMLLDSLEASGFVYKVNSID